MKLLPFILLLSSCSTMVYYPNGQKLARIESNVIGLDIAAQGITVRAARIDTAGATRAAFYGVAHIISVGGTAAAPWAGGPLASKAIPLIPAAIPAARTNPSSQ